MTRSRCLTVFLLVLGFSFVACSGSEPTGDTDPPVQDDTGKDDNQNGNGKPGEGDDPDNGQEPDPGDDPGNGDDPGEGDGPGDEPTEPVCSIGAIRCVDDTTQEVCEQVDGEAKWVAGNCSPGSLCLSMRCSAECVDECNLRETRTIDGRQETCSLFSVSGYGSAALSDGMHDRARKYNSFIREWALPSGTILNTIFTDANHHTLHAYVGDGDSAIWTGAYLAAEALRLLATGSPDADRNMRDVVASIHRLFQITGHPGFMARFAGLLHGDPRVTALYKPEIRGHHEVRFQGEDWFWGGKTSRDQYQGVLLGYGHAYEALDSPEHRQMIREDVVALASELMKERKDVPVTFEFYALGGWRQQRVLVDMEHIVLNPSEFENGGPFIRVGSENDPSDYNDTDMHGLQEFMPDLSVLLKQVPILGSLVRFPIPRGGSAMMLAATIRLGILVTEGVPGYERDHEAFEAYYEQNIDDWLDVMNLYVFPNKQQCWQSYYGLNITFMAMYTLARLEPDPRLRQEFQGDILEGKMWSLVEDHKNVFFSYIHASQTPNIGSVQDTIEEANAQLAQFPPPPYWHVAVDNSGLYPEDGSCPGKSSVAIDVKDRVPSDFIWQRDPFSLATAVRSNRAYPGVDYLIPYWMGRYYGFLEDDAKDTCLRWQ